MVDFIKIESALTKDAEIVLKEKLSLKFKVDHQTGEFEEYPLIGTFENMKITIYRSKIVIQGSIHRYFNLIKNKEDHNYNEFSHEDLKMAINSLQEGLGINIMLFKVINLEFGFNINLDIPPGDLLRQNVTLYKYKGPTRSEEKPNNGHYIEFGYKQYYLKVYDKGAQYRQGNIARIEIKYVRSVLLKKLKVNKLGDVFILDCLNLLFENMDLVISNFLILNIKEIDLIQDKMAKEIITNGLNPQFWEEMDGVVCARTISRRKRKFRELIFNLDLNTRTIDLRQRMSSIYSKLIS